MADSMENLAWDALKDRDLELGPGAQLAAGGDNPWKNWRLTNDEDGIAWLILDQQGASANTLSEAVLTELDAISRQDRS